MMDRHFDHRALPEQPCPACGTPLDCVTEMDAPETGTPQPGDETVCLRCTTVLVFGFLGELQIAPPRQISAQALAAQTRLQEAKRRLAHGGAGP